MGQLKPTQVLNKAYRQIAVETTDFEHFKSALQILLDNVSDGQREETQKEHLRNFLSETFYKPYYMAPEEIIKGSGIGDLLYWICFSRGEGYR